MIPDTYRPLFRRLYDRTVAGEVNWKQTADENTMAVHVRDFTLTMLKGVDYQDQEAFIRWELLNDAGKEIDAFSVSENDDDWQEAQDLWDRARRKAIRLDEALATIMKELEDPKPLGADAPHKTRQASRPSPSPFDADDDDLPF